MWDRLALRPVNCVTGNARFLCRYGNVVAAMPPADDRARAMKPHLECCLEQETRKFRCSIQTKSSVLPEAGGILRLRKLRHSYSTAPAVSGGQDRPRVWRLRHGPLADLVAEGNVGLMQALARFAPERGFACHLRHLVDPGSDPGARYPQPLAGDLTLQDRTRIPL